MNTPLSALTAYFETELPKLEKSYQWKIPKINGFLKCGEKGYQPNVELKKYLAKMWSSSTTKERYEVARIIVADWGGVKRNNPTTLQGYVDEAESDKPQIPFKGITSYSKIFSIADMTKYAIYDAKVAACLNAVQWNSGVKEGIVFNYVNGRNNITGNATKKTGFVYDERFKINALVDSGWFRIKKDNTYQTYLNTLGVCLVNFPDYNLYDLEMVLFANAEKECLKAMKSV